MKTYIVTVDKMMFEGDKVWQTRKYKILAEDKPGAVATVNNYLALHEEPRFRIAKVEEYNEH